MQRLVAIGLFVCLGLSACDPIAMRSVIVHAPAAAQSTNAGAISLSGVSDSDVHATITIVERVLVLHGFHREKPANKRGVVASFRGEFHADGSTPGCDIYRLSEEASVKVLFTEWARFSSSNLVREAQQEVVSALTRRFGPARVTKQ